MPEEPHSDQIELTEVNVASARGGTASQIDSINWRVKRGDYWVIGGAHASGKSDLLATAAGLQRPLSGSVKLFGQEINGLGENEFLELRLKIGIVFKSGGRMINHLTLAENIALPLRYRLNCGFEQVAETVENLLRATELLDHAHLTSGMLTATSLQRAGLARALALKPSVLLLDEPIASLELRHRRWWLDFLEQLSAGRPETGGEPVTLAVTTNDLIPWANVGRQFAVLDQKRWKLIGGREQLKGAPTFDLGDSI